MKSNNKLPLGIFSWFGFRIPLQERIRLIKEAGFDAIGIWWGDEKAYRYEEKARIPRFIRQCGLTLDNIHVPYNDSNDLWSDDYSIRQSFVNKYIRWLQECAEYEIPTLVMHVTRGIRGNIPNEYGVFAMQSIIDAAERLGVNIAIENTRKPECIDLLLLQIQSKRLGFCYDASHDWLYSSQKTEMLKRHGKRLLATHFADTDGRIDRHWLPEDGIINWGFILDAFPIEEYSGTLMLEVFCRKEDLKSSAIDYLKKAYSKALWLQNMIYDKAASQSNEK